MGGTEARRHRERREQEFLNLRRETGTGAKAWVLQSLVRLQGEACCAHVGGEIVVENKACVSLLGYDGPAALVGEHARVLLAAYKCRPRAIVEAVPAWVSEEILSASERVADRRAVLWVSKN